VTLTHVEIGVEEGRHHCYEMNDGVFDSVQKWCRVLLIMAPFALIVVNLKD
jgi:hypothetical protein